MRLSVESITPTVAQAILTKSAGQLQRRINTVRVSQLADAIKRGQWQLNHQPIAIDPDGACFDGQHRLSAVVEADTAVDMLVARDADPATFLTIDLRGTRRPSDALHIAGFPDTNVLAAAARLILIVDKFTGRSTIPGGATRTGITNQDILDVMESERGTIIMSGLRDATAVATAVGQGGAKTPLLVARTKLIEAGAPDDLRESFWSAVESGAMLDPSSPMFTLRRWLIQSYSFADRGARSYVVTALVIKAWNAWVQGDTPAYLRFQLGRDSFPAIVPDRAHVDLEALERAALDLEALDREAANA